MSTNTTQPTVLETLTAACAEMPSEVLADSLRMIEATSTPTADERLVRCALITVLGGRFNLADALEAWVTSDSVLTQGQLVLALLPQEVGA